MIGQRVAVLLGLCVLAAGTVTGCAGAGRAAEGVTVTLESGGRQREYVVHTPAQHGSGPLPVVLVFHGGGGSAREMQRHAGFDQLADQYGFLGVYPAGVERSWNDGRGDDTKAGAEGVDDVAFVSAIIDQLVAERNADPKRVYATGISNGGMFTEQLGCRLGDKLAAIAPVAGPLPQADVASCAPAQPVSVLEIHGTADPIVPYGGGVVRVTSGNRGGAGSSPVLSVDATQQMWRTIDGCAGTPATAALPRTVDDGTSVTVTTADACRGGKVQLYSVDNGGHTWPGGSQYLPEALIGKVSHQFDAAAVIWRFFADQHR